MRHFGVILDKTNAGISDKLIDCARRATWIARDAPRKGVEPTLWRSRSGRLMLFAWGSAPPMGLLGSQLIVKRGDFALAGSGYYYHPNYSTPEELLASLAQTRNPEAILADMGGTFAICVCDGGTDRFRLWRSVAGSAAYYRETTEMLVVGDRGLFVSCVSELSDQPRYDPDGIGRFCVTGLFMTDLTAFRGVAHVPGHSVLEASVEQVRISAIDSAFDGFGFSNRLPTDADFDDLADIFLTGMRSLKSDNLKVALGLSGGRDSRLIAAGLRAAGVGAAVHCGRNWSDHPDLLLGQRVAQLLDLELAPVRIIDVEAPNTTASAEVRIDPYLGEQLRRWDAIKVSPMGVPVHYRNSLKYHDFREEESLGAIYISGSSGEAWRGGYARRTFAGDLGRTEEEMWRIFSNVFIAPGEILKVLKDQNRDSYLRWFRQWFDQNYQREFPEAVLERAYIFLSLNREYVAESSYSLLGDARLLRHIGKFSFSARNDDVFHFETIRRLAPQLEMLPLEGSRWQFEINGPDDRYRNGYEARKPLPYGRISEGVPSVRYAAATDLREFFLARIVESRHDLSTVLDPDALDSFLYSRASLCPAGRIGHWSSGSYWFIDAAALLLSGQWLREYDIESVPIQHVRLDAPWHLLYGAVFDAVEGALAAAPSSMSDEFVRDLERYRLAPDAALPDSSAFRHDIEQKRVAVWELSEAPMPAVWRIAPPIEDVHIDVVFGNPMPSGSARIKISTSGPRSATSWMRVSLGRWQDLAGYSARLSIHGWSDVAEARMADVRLQEHRNDGKHILDTRVVRSAPKGVETEINFYIPKPADIRLGAKGGEEEVEILLPIGALATTLSYEIGPLQLSRDEYLAISNDTVAHSQLAQKIIGIGHVFSMEFRTEIQREIERHKLNAEKVNGLLSKIAIGDDPASARASLFDVWAATPAWLDFQLGDYDMMASGEISGECANDPLHPYRLVSRSMRRYMRMTRDRGLEAFGTDPIWNDLAPQVPDHRGSGFRAILRLLGLPIGCKVLDVGAGGFLGETTTVHLLDVLQANVIGIELDIEKAQRLKEKFGERIEVFIGRWEEYSTEEPQDLIIFDLDSQSIPTIFDSFIESALPMLGPRGVIVSLFIYDADAVFDSEKPLLNPRDKQLHKAFLMRKFGTDKVDRVAAEKAFSGSAFAVRGITDKWMEHRGLGWIALQKRS
jgi:hypothetical protein